MGGKLQKAKRGKADNQADKKNSYEPPKNTYRLILIRQLFMHENTLNNFVPTETNWET